MGNKRHINIDRVKPTWIWKGEIVLNNIEISEKEKYNSLLINTESKEKNKEELMKILY